MHEENRSMAPRVNPEPPVVGNTGAGEVAKPVSTGDKTKPTPIANAAVQAWQSGASGMDSPSSHVGRLLSTGAQASELPEDQATSRTGIDKAAGDLRRQEGGISGELTDYFRSVGGRDYEVGRLAAIESLSKDTRLNELVRKRIRGEPLPEGGTELKIGNRSFKVDAKSLDALTSPDPKTRSDGIQKLAQAYADGRHWQRLFGKLDPSTSPPLIGQQRAYLEALNNPDTKPTARKHALDALDRIPAPMRSPDAARALEDAKKANFGRPTEPKLAAEFDRLARTDPKTLSQAQLRSANEFLDKYPPLPGASEGPAKELHDRYDDHRRALKDQNDVHQRAGFSGDSAFQGDDAKLVQDVRTRIATASPADARAAREAVDRLEKSGKLPGQEAGKLRKRLAEREEVAERREGKAKLHQAFDKANAPGRGSGSDKARESLKKLDDALRSVEAQKPGTKELEDARQQFESARKSAALAVQELEQSASGKIVDPTNSHTGFKKVLPFDDFVQRQELPYSCGPAAVRMILRYSGVDASESTIRKDAGTSELLHGTPSLALSTYVLRSHLANRSPPLTASFAEGTPEERYAQIRESLAKGRPVLFVYNTKDDFSSSSEKKWQSADEEKVLHYGVIVGIDEERREVHVANPFGGERDRAHKSGNRFEGKAEVMSFSDWWNDSNGFSGIAHPAVILRTPQEQHEIDAQRWDKWDKVAREWEPGLPYP
jgi:hypothetical protein